MNNHQIYCVNAPVHFSSVSLISAYNAHTYGEHRNSFITSEDQYEMYCMIFTLNGSAKIVLKDGREFDLQKSSVFFGCNTDIQYMESNCEHWHQLAYWFTIQNIELQINSIYTLNNLDATKEATFIDKIICLMQTQQENNLNYANALCAEKLFETLGKINYSRYKHNEKLDKILFFINANIEKNLTLKEIAEEFHYCEKHLNHIFQTMMGVPPKKFISDTKLNNVCFLLSTTSLTLQELAEKYSYVSASHLAHRFKQKFGITPTEYRTKTLIAQTPTLPPLKQSRKQKAQKGN